MRIEIRLLLLAVGILFALSRSPASVAAQVADSTQASANTQVEETLPDELRPKGVSPRGAFIRSSLIPGWGHAEVGAHVRGTFYFTAQAATALMVFKTQTRISRTERRLEVREASVRARLVAEGVTNPVSIESALAEDPQVEDLRALREVRGDQREDWLALGIFLMLIGGVDGYVSAHLADFPTAVTIEPTPARGVEVGISLPVRF